MKIRFIASLFALAFSFTSTAQDTKKVLFLGNSYTAVNNLPQMVAQVANSVGDTVEHDSNAPGGYTFQGHSTNSTSLAKIAVGDWDYVVLQEQSQLPSFPDWQVQNNMYPYAAALNQEIKDKNPCAETLFYMTWGRKNGDSDNCGGWPPVCTYEGMDNLIRDRYIAMANDNDALLSPVGAVWRYIRTNYPEIELYTSDESHPSVAGTYAAACSFYSVIFRKDPTTITFDASLPALEAQKIRLATKHIVFDNLLEWNVGLFDPIADFTFENTANTEYAFTNLSEQATSYLWDFGDGNTSTDENPIYSYTATGTYTVSLTATHCDWESTFSQTIEVNQLSLPKHTSNEFVVYPNPSNFMINIKVAPHQIGQDYIMYDYNGRRLLSGRISQTTTTVQISDMASGLYFIQLGADKSNVVKFVKQ
jgi:PKD repeat protein